MYEAFSMVRLSSETVSRGGRRSDTVLHNDVALSETRAIVEKEKLKVTSQFPTSGHYPQEGTIQPGH